MIERMSGFLYPKHKLSLTHTPSLLNFGMAESSLDNRIGIGVDGLGVSFHTQPEKYPKAKRKKKKKKDRSDNDALELMLYAVKYKL